MNACLNACEKMNVGMNAWIMYVSEWMLECKYVCLSVHVHVDECMLRDPTHLWEENYDGVCDGWDGSASEVGKVRARDHLDLWKLYWKYKSLMNSFINKGTRIISNLDQSPTNLHQMLESSL